MGEEYSNLLSELASFQNFSHIGFADQLEVGAKAANLMESIGNWFPGIKRHKALRLDVSEIKIFQSGKDLIRGKLFRQFHLQNAKKEKREEAGKEMRLDAILPLDKDGSGGEISFENPETCFNLPAALTDTEDIGGRVLQQI